MFIEVLIFYQWNKKILKLLSNLLDLRASIINTFAFIINKIKLMKLPIFYYFFLKKLE